MARTKQTARSRQVARPHENSWRQRQLVRVPQPPDVSRNPIVIDLVPWLSVATRSLYRASDPQIAHPATCPGLEPSARLHRISRRIFVSNPLPPWLFSKGWFDAIKLWSIWHPCYPCQSWKRGGSRFSAARVPMPGWVEVWSSRGGAGRDLGSSGQGGAGRDIGDAGRGG